MCLLRFLRVVFEEAKEAKEAKEANGESVLGRRCRCMVSTISRGTCTSDDHVQSNILKKRRMPNRRSRVQVR